jgi:hypothetical protein
MSLLVCHRLDLGLSFGIHNFSTPPGSGQLPRHLVGHRYCSPRVETLLSDPDVEVKETNRPVAASQKAMSSYFEPRRQMFKVGHLDQQSSGSA